MVVVAIVVVVAAAMVLDVIVMQMVTSYVRQNAWKRQYKSQVSNRLPGAAHTHTTQ